MDKAKGEPDLAELFLNRLPHPPGRSLPMPRFGEVPHAAQQAEPLPPVGQSGARAETREPFSLSWVDEEGLGIRVFIREEETPEGIEVRAYAEGVRSDLRGKGISVALVADKADHFKRVTIVLDQPSRDGRGCTGNGRFGTATDLRHLLGEKVGLDVFLLE